MFYFYIFMKIICLVESVDGILVNRCIFVFHTCLRCIILRVCASPLTSVVEAAAGCSVMWQTYL